MYSALAETKLISAAVRPRVWPVATHHQGQRVPAEYEVLGRIATGAMSTVYLARHRESNIRVALKVLAPHLAGEPAERARLNREARALAALDHPSIIRPFDYGLEADLAFLAMEYFPGRNLAEIVERRGPLRIDSAMRVIAQAAEGLRHAHDEGFVHRDIKPANLLFNTRDRLKIVDWGLVRLPERLLETAKVDGVDDVAFMGTPFFMPPEQCVAPNDVSPASDIYSLGCTLYYLLRGRSPFERGNTWDTIRAQREAPIPSLRLGRRDVPAWLDAIFARMVAKQPQDRFGSMAELLAALAMQDPVARRPR
jgi:serine/threonine protein kinase